MVFFQKASKARTTRTVDKIVDLQAAVLLFQMSDSCSVLSKRLRTEKFFVVECYAISAKD